MGQQLKLCVDCKNCFKSSRQSDDHRFRYGCLKNATMYMKKTGEPDEVDVVTGERINHIVSIPDTCWYYRYNVCGYENPKHWEPNE